MICDCLSVYIFTEPSPGPIQSLNRDVCEFYVCVCVQLWKPSFPMDWTFLVKERIANIGKPQTFSSFVAYDALQTSLLHRLQEQTLPDEGPPIGKIHHSAK